MRVPALVRMNYTIDAGVNMQELADIWSCS